MINFFLIAKMAVLVPTIVLPLYINSLILSLCDLDIHTPGLLLISQIKSLSHFIFFSGSHLLFFSIEHK